MAQFEQDLTRSPWAEPASEPRLVRYAITIAAIGLGLLAGAVIAHVVLDVLLHLP